MDKLDEPTYQADPVWKRIRYGAEEQIQSKQTKRHLLFWTITTLSLYRFYRERTFYNKQMDIFVGIIVPSFLFSSWQIACYLTAQPFAISTVKNNGLERSFIDQYGELYKTANQKGLKVPNELLLK